MRSTKMVSVWPVGLAGGLKFEGPICSGDTVKHWYAYWARDRKFQIDFAGEQTLSLSLSLSVSFCICVSVAVCPSLSLPLISLSLFVLFCFDIGTCYTSRV